MSRKELYFDGPTTLRDLIEKYPEVLNIQIAVQDRDYYTLIGTQGSEGTMGAINISEAKIDGAEVPIVLFCGRTDYNKQTLRNRSFYFIFGFLMVASS